MSRKESPAAEVQIYLMECATKEIRNEVVAQCKQQEGSEVLFAGRDDDGKYVVVHALTASAITTLAVKYHGKWGFPELTQEHLATYTVVAEIKIDTNRH